ncbi:MAG: diadenylate cyclase CdaA [Ignavibacteria bacterium]|nr:diadenylate cyclase CdaA [Ignavibacteria bacterium]MBT8381571.1 diadenylate cyclase CdaA [Ignavibacteria bacterium]MBT8390301.1 diadenylate cyclase CdaA [Ignavibacteria bacterium]NNJ53068.1 TIGR00159 family protein [Ignavibacteriaceae bacterium]NNL20272.1 TIGR00159 family protein [Ignavibacteriaceae bacterium]
MFEIFKIGFLSVSFIDVIDVFVVAFILYKLYTILRGTIAAQIFLGLMIIMLFRFSAEAVQLKALTWLLRLVTDIWVIAFIILFQPEIRRLLVLLARNPIIKMFGKAEVPEAAEIITEAAFELSQRQYGALIIIVRETGIRGYAETGEILNAKVNKSLLTSIFFPKSPLHDGAVIIKGNMIEAARCTLPLSPTTEVEEESLGMRHRAGLGISEQADVISVIVSEETGSISVAEYGKLESGLSKDSLREKLKNAFKAPTKKGWKNLFEQIKKEK